MRIPRRARFALAAVVGLMTILLAPQAAFAAYYGSELNYATQSDWPDTDNIYDYIGTTGAGAKFIALGDYFYVLDTVADGHSAAAMWFDADSTRSGSCVSQWGAGHAGVCNKNFVEGHKIYFSAAVYESGNLVRQSGWISMIA